MPAILSLCHSFGLQLPKLSKIEFALLENVIFEQACREIKAIIKNQEQPYSKLIKDYQQVEDEMLEQEIIRFVIKDMVNSGDYNLAGIAIHTRIPEEVLVDIITGKNTNPSYISSRRILALHRYVRPDFYKNILKKIIDELNEESDQ